MNRGDLANDRLRVSCSLFRAGYIDEAENTVIGGFAPEDCERSGEITGNYLPVGWGLKERFPLCTSCLVRWNDRFDQEAALADIMEGVA